MEWYLVPWKKYAVFSGRARRREYWTFGLVNIVIGWVTVILSWMPIMPVLILLSLYSLAALIPGLAVAVRRLHDTNRSGWWVLLDLVPFGWIVLLIFLVEDSQPGVNQYGADPKAGEGALHPLQGISAAQPPVSASYCYSCGTRLTPGGSFCQKCGARAAGLA